MFRFSFGIRRTSQIAALFAMLLTPLAAYGQTSIRADEARLEIKRQVPISTEVTGKLVTVTPSEEGQYVKKDDLLIEVNDELIRKEVAEATKKAESEVEIAFAEVAKKKAEVDMEQRVEANKEFPTFSPTEMRQTALEVEKSRASLDKAIEDKAILGLTVETKKAQLAQYKVYAPFGGMVTNVQRWPGHCVRPGDPILTITDMTELRAVLKIDYKRRNEVFVGDPVEIRIDTTGKSLRERPNAFTDDEQPRTDAEAEDFFGRGGPTESAPSILPQEPEEVFTGTIRFLDPTLVTKDSTVYLSVHVDVQNRQDNYGRYVLQQGLPIEAIIIPQKRTAIIPQKRIE